MSIALLLLAAVLSDTTTVKLSASPSPVYVEASNGAQVVNCDLIVDNPTGAPLDIDEITAPSRASARSMSPRFSRRERR